MSLSEEYNQKKKNSPGEVLQAIQDGDYVLSAQALAWAKENGKLMVSGSDFHTPEHLARGGTSENGLTAKAVATPIMAATAKALVILRLIMINLTQ